MFLTLKAEGCEVTLEERPSYCDRGNWLAKVHPRGCLFDLDGQDGWLRYYFALDRAKLEVEAWLAKRNLPVKEGWKEGSM